MRRADNQYKFESSRNSKNIFPCENISDEDAGYIIDMSRKAPEKKKYRDSTDYYCQKPDTLRNNDISACYSKNLKKLNSANESLSRVPALIREKHPQYCQTLHRPRITSSDTPAWLADNPSFLLLVGIQGCLILLTAVVIFYRKLF